jgi:hypothetical protein
MSTNNEIFTPLDQHGITLAFAASGTPIVAQGTTSVLNPPGGLKLVAGNALAAAAQTDQTPPVSTCQQCLTLNFFFDGTGNNLDADLVSMQHSNVAKLFQSRLLDDNVVNRYSFYVPGLGTYFEEIGDRGNTKTGKGAGGMGEERLEWAFKKFDKALAIAVARAQNPTNKIRFKTQCIRLFTRDYQCARFCAQHGRAL